MAQYTRFPDINAEGLHRVDVYIQSPGYAWSEDMLGFCNDELRAGEYAFGMTIVNQVRHHGVRGSKTANVRFYFTDPDVAFEFKMRFAGT